MGGDDNSTRRGVRRSSQTLRFAVTLSSLSFWITQVQGFELSCANSRVPAHPMAFCNIVTWRAAALYSHINYTDFQPGSMFSDDDQDRIARRQYQDLMMGKENVGPTCQKSLQRFVCASVFPECPNEGLGVPFVPVCRTLCREAEIECGIPLSCEFFQSKDCTAAVEDGFFVLKEDQGPYEPLPYLYAILLVVWSCLTFMWLYHTFVRNRGAGSRLCRLLSCVPIAKVTMMLLSLAFWSTCVKWGYCSFWMGVSLINCQLMYETFSLIGFVLIAKGWCITRPNFHPNEWRTVIILMCSFYLASSSLLLIRRIVLSSVVFWLCTGLLYGSAYAYVIYNVQDRLKSIRQQMRRALQETPGETFRFDLMMLKHWMYQTLSVLLTIFCVTELFFCLLPIVHHVDLSYIPSGVKNFLDAIAELDARLWLTLIIHEVVEIVILFMVGFLFRPRLLSTFFYIEVDYSELRGRQPKGTPLYLIPVPSENYACDGALIVPRSKLSPVDLQFTITSSTPRNCGLRGRGHHHHHHQNGDGGGGGAASLHQRQATNRMVMEMVQTTIGVTVASGAGQLGGGRGRGGVEIFSEETQSLLDPNDASAHSDQEATGCSKAMYRYHASRFLVVLQPDNTYMVAVQEGSQHSSLPSPASLYE